MTISQNHPLRRLFTDVVRRQFAQGLQLHDTAITDYIAGVLLDFTRAENLYRIRNIQGSPLRDVAEMLIASNPLLDADSFDRERAVRKHVGDFTLFFTGIFPEAVAGLPRFRPLSLDAFIDYVSAGKESYGVVAAFDLFEYQDEAPLFRQLSDQFEQCVYGLNLVKQEIEQLQAGPYQQMRADLGLNG
jgi:hypothetical protein